ncbi:MAG: hypothetical protein ABI488_02375, partial [Polyangiaceae bacterium]
PQGQQPQGQQPQGQQPQGQQPQGQQGKSPPSGEEHGEAEAPSRPGELSKSEARALLDSLRGDLQVKPSAPTPPHAITPDQPQKDW